MSLLDKPLGQSLTQQDRMYLASMAHHDGFPVLQKLFDEICRAAHVETAKVDPKSFKSRAEYMEVLAATQTEERCINLFCEAVRKNFNWNSELAIQEVEKEANKEEKRRSAN